MLYTHGHQGQSLFNTTVPFLGIHYLWTFDSHYSEHPVYIHASEAESDVLPSSVTVYVTSILFFAFVCYVVV